MKDEVRNYLKVSEYNAYIKSVLDNDELLRNVFVLGEVTDLSPRGEHLFFTLKDEYTKMSVVCLGYKRLYQPRRGETVMIMGYPDYYERGGKLSFNAYNIEPVGIGKMHQDLEKLKEKLTYMGYFDVENKKSIPRYPQNICILTSADGAVFFDIFQTIREINNLINITLIDVRVQGEMAEDNIVKNLIEADKMNFDVIILARGGGSFEDLLPFSAEKLIKTIFSMVTPIITAVGHETDTPLCDLVADKRAITPTQAGKIVAYDVEELKADLLQNLNKCSYLVELKYTRLYNKIIALAKRISLKSQLSLNFQSNKLQRKIQVIREKISQKFNVIDNNLQKKISLFDSLNPAKILSKGYFGVTKDNIKVTKIQELEQGDVIRVIGKDCLVQATVNKKENI